MGALGDINELSEVLGIKISKIRNWKKEKIFVPMAKDPDNGKTLLFNIECERIKFKVAQELLLDFSLKEIGARFQKVFGRRNARLLQDLQKARNDGELMERYVKEIMSLEL